MLKRSVYPRGFDRVERTDGDTDVKAMVDGDLEVTVLYHQYMKHDAVSTTWAFRKAVLVNARYFFGPYFYTWLDQQLANRYLGDNARKFLVDTLRFLETGKRSVSPLNWLPLMDNHPVETAASSTVEVRRSSDQSFNESVNRNPIRQWLVQPGGFEDLLLTLYVMYGEMDVEAAFQAAGGKLVQSPKNHKIQLLRSALEL